MKIETNSQYHAALALIESFIKKGFNNLTKAETEKLAELSKSIEEYETQKYPMPLRTDVIDIFE